MLGAGLLGGSLGQGTSGSDPTECPSRVVLVVVAFSGIEPQRLAGFLPDGKEGVESEGRPKAIRPPRVRVDPR
jgi:hypothetical protein